MKASLAKAARSFDALRIKREAESGTPTPAPVAEAPVAEVVAEAPVAEVVAEAPAESAPEATPEN
jgi:large subunit ribosomal protein L10